MLTVCTGRTFRHLLLTVRNSAAVLDMTGGDQATKLSAFILSSWLHRFLALPSIALPKKKPPATQANQTLHANYN